MNLNRTPHRPPALPAEGTRAFTLIELMLALVIFAVVLAAVSGVFHGAMRLRARTMETLEAALPVEQALAVVRRDLAGIVLPTGTLHSNLVVTAGSGAGAVQDTDMQIYTTATTAAVALDGLTPWGGVQKVAYTLRAPTNAFSGPGRDLVRRVCRNLLPTLQEEFEEQPLLAGVERIDFQFHDGLTWRTSWVATNEASLLPRAIRFQLLMAPRPLPSGSLASGAGRQRDPIELVVPLLVSGTNTLLLAEQSGTGGQP